MLFLAMWLDLVGGSDCFSAGETVHEADYMGSIYPLNLTDQRGAQGGEVPKRLVEPRTAAECTL